jgi:hypothetical protein
MSHIKSQGAVLLRLIGIGFLLFTTTLAQESLRQIDKTTWRSEPIRIQKLRIAGGNEVEVGKKFAAEGEWLKGLTVSVENISTKAIARIELNLAFPRIQGASSEVPTYIVRMIYGLDPSDPAYTESQKPTLPGETVEVKLPDANLSVIKAALKSLGYPENVWHAQIRIESVTFLDGSTWAGDEILYPDPKDPPRKINPRLQRQKLSPNPPMADEIVRRTELQPWWFQKADFTFDSAFDLYTGPISLRNLMTAQDDTLPCNTVFVVTETHNCGTEGSGCTFKQNIFDGSIELLGLRNARSQLSSVRCQKSDGTFCTDTILSNFARLPCGVRVAGTCAAVADWATYPSTGCITGLIFGGPCTRSNAFQTRCASPTGYDPDYCNCPDGIDTSPIVIDFKGSGFSMTDAVGGVAFDILNDSVPVQLSWTAPGSTNAFLALDRNGNGTIDSGAELFGNITPQPPSNEANGFKALAEYDKPENGGNNNGKIDRQDTIFNQLRLWQDQNHNGVSEPSELIPLARVISAIDLAYKESKRIDENGNRFRYRAKVYDINGQQTGRWAWDVFFKVL